MRTLHEPRGVQVNDRPAVPAYSWWRLLALCALFLLSVIVYILLIGAAPPNDYVVSPFLHVEILSYIPYLAACAFVLATRPVPGRWRWIEISNILVGALVFRAMLLHLPPGLSRDSWRYLWDARVTLHGFSPYVYAPFDKALVPLRDTVLLPNIRFRTSPTIYPPGAQGIYLLSYLLAGPNLFFLKGIFLIFDMVTCIGLVILLGRKGLDQRRVLLYAWCPLPIIEFAIEGHVDAITLTFTILAVLAATNTSLRGRLLTGFLIGLATLTKIYPILLLVALVPALPNLRFARLWWEDIRDIIRYNAAIFIACCVTIVLGYLPYFILGHGQVTGYFATYASEQGENAGVVQQFVSWLGAQYQLSLKSTISLEHITDVLLVAAASLFIFVLRLYDRISMEAAVFLLFGVILSISSHVFPWYTTTLLLWVPVLIGPIWKHKMLVGGGLAIIVVWFFTLSSIYGYFFKGIPGQPHPVPDWTPYYNFVYWPVVVGLAVAAIIGMANLYRFRRGQ
ncbi:MAG TPA: glycosyltransferase 87 family protein [Ktedonobacteraceae bacterium]|jgi:hypothetical protein|nr:glycosyltransferase 87 family protein [Ktedonobacteraceae bacterium]